MSDLIERLETTRAGYDEEQAYHRLLVDAYTGGGGFSGSTTRSPAELWNPAGPLSMGAQKSYLDRYPREDDKRFARRLQVAHYPNYIQPLTDLKTSFILRKEFAVDGRPEPLVDWRSNVDGRSTTWDELLPMLAIRAATLGWAPVLIDAPPNPTGEPLTRLQARDLGLEPVAVPLFPANLVDYDLDETGSFNWAKIRTDYIVKPDWRSDEITVTRYTIWNREYYDQYELAQGQSGTSLADAMEGVPHGFGEVPIAILTHKPTLDDPIKGLPMHGQESIEARRLFNLHSELDEHMRSQVFSILVLAMDASQSKGKISIGTENALALDPSSGQKHYFMSPDASVAASYEQRIEACIQEIYRQARVEFVRPTQSRTAVSGIARKFEFAQTDRALAAYAQQIARFEEHVDMLVGRGLGVSEDRLQQISITAPQSFDIEDLQQELQIAVDAITLLQVGPTAERMLRKRAVEQLLPNLPVDERGVIEQELEEIARTEQLDAQMDEEIEAAEEEEQDAAAVG